LFQGLAKSILDIASQVVKYRAIVRENVGTTRPVQGLDTHPRVVVGFVGIG
jgi:hypothetical protein